MSDAMFVLLGSSVALLGLFGWWVWSRFERSEPNQWLLLIRGGKPIKAGIGIQVWKRPGDAVARFTSTMQRVTFDAPVLTSDKQQLQVKGFLLWVVSAEEEAPFRAFSRLGIAHRDAIESQDPTYHHALSRAQHHAFRRSVEAAIHKAAVSFSLRQALDDPEQLARQVQQDMTETVKSWGIVLETLELTDLTVAHAELFEHMQAPYIAESRKEATELKLATDAEIAQMTITQERETARQRAEVARQKERELAEIALAQAKEAAAMAEEKAAVEQQALEQALAAEEAAAAARNAQELRHLERHQRKAILEQQHEHELHAQMERLHDLEADAAIQREQRKHDAERSHLEAMIAIERDKPDALRDAEQARHVVDAASRAVSDLPLHEIRWLSHSADQGPAGLVLGMIDALQQAASTAIAPKQ